MGAAPLLFEPYLRPQVWGGRRLGQVFHKQLPDENTYGESWEVSAHPLHLSRVASGPESGRTLADLAARNPRMLYGRRVPPGRNFPILVKWLDCQDRLSVQVHPSDEFAARYYADRPMVERGKTEAWVIVQASPGSRVYAGLKQGITRQTLQTALETGNVVDCLHSFAPQPGDCLYLPAGTVHAASGGVVFAEVQQSSDATFRLYDWDRVGKEGVKRPLHLKESFEAIDFSRGPIEPIRRSGPLPLLERLVACPFFQMDRLQIAGTGDVMPVHYEDELSIWMVLDGRGWLVPADALAADGKPEAGLRMHRGQTILMPAGADTHVWVNAGPTPLTLLAATLPSQ